jgi:predicted membrane protein
VVIFSGTMTDRAWAGAKFGALMATFYTAYVLLLYAFHGSAPFDALGVSIGALVGAYYGTGILVGGIAGLCWPVAKTRIGATALGIVCAFIGIGGRP